MLEINMSAFVNSHLDPIYPSGWVHNGVQYPDRVFREWSNSELASIGIYRVVYEDFVIPDGKRIKEYTYQIEGDVAIASPVFEDIPVVVPQVVSRAQGKAALLQAGLLGLVEHYIENLQGDQKTMALIAFNDTTEWRRDSPFLAQAASALGMTQEHLDNLFLLAESIIL